MIQDLTLFTKHEYLPWQQLRYGPHVGDLHVVAETCSAPHLAESLFPPAEGAHSCSCLGHGPPGGVGEHPPCRQQGTANYSVRCLLVMGAAVPHIDKTLDDGITQYKACVHLRFAFPAVGQGELSKSLTSPGSFSPPSSLSIAPQT